MTMDVCTWLIYPIRAHILLSPKYDYFNPWFNSIWDYFSFLTNFIIQEEKKSSKEYEHINKAQSHFDKQVVDAGTQEQALEAPAPANTEEDEDNKMENEEEMMDTPMEVRSLHYFLL